ncbi:MAG: glycosyl hydrolase 53 family protein [Bacteroidota bacterium]|nr:glycosyl hydrolase 53 family protein [Bacteroidota bacterium]
MTPIKKNLLVFFFCCLIACNKSNSNNFGGIFTPPPATPSNFAKGADVSWLTQMESSGRTFLNSSGTVQDFFQILKNLGMNSIRLRVWVDPAGGWNNTADVLAKALRAKALGLRMMIDFHYSDSWADPGQQNKPAAWAAQDFATLQTSVYNHTFNVLTTLKTNGIIPEWVQVGNETNDGMLWPTGKASLNMSNFAILINKGYDAVKAVDNTIKVIVYISNGYDNSLFRRIFDGLKNNGGKWDVIGMSLYPTATNWATLNTQCPTNMNDMVARYDKPVMICEVGMSWDLAATCNSFLTDLITKVRSIAGSKGLGVFYWEPQACNNWLGYTLGAFDNSGKPTLALNAFN